MTRSADSTDGDTTQNDSSDSSTASRTSRHSGHLTFSTNSGSTKVQHKHLCYLCCCLFQLNQERNHGDFPVWTNDHSEECRRRLFHLVDVRKILVLNLLPSAERSHRMDKDSVSDRTVSDIWITLSRHGNPHCFLSNFLANDWPKVCQTCYPCKTRPPR